MSMDQFLPAYLAELTASLTAQVLNALGQRATEAVLGSEEERAIERSLQAGVAAMLDRVTERVPDVLNLLRDIFSQFFMGADISPDVGDAIEPLFWGRSLDVERLRQLFEQAGYVPEQFPGFDFAAGIRAFEEAVSRAVAGEAELQQMFQTKLAATRTKESLIQTELKRETGEEVRKVRRILDPAEWEGHYLRTLISRCDPLDLSPLHETATHSGDPGALQPIRISDVFTTLYLKGVGRFPNQPVDEAIKMMSHRQSTVIGLPDDEKVQPIAALEAVAAMPRLVILGEPGCGKSTLVNHLATQLAQRRLGISAEQKELPGWPADQRPLPVRIMLRRFAAKLPEGARQGEAVHVWDYLQYQLEQWGCPEFYPSIKQTLSRDGGIVFFDGLDEVQEADTGKRSLIKDAIVRFAAPLTRCRIIVTCREYAYKRGQTHDGWILPEAEFPSVELALFDLEQIEQFTTTWYRVTQSQTGWDEEKCQKEAESLFGAIRDWKHLRDLAKYPLLLTLMAQVHGRQSYLPQDRADLYRSAVNLLLSHWDNRIVRDAGGECRVEQGLIMRLGIRLETLLRALQGVAYQAHLRQQREPTRTERAADIPREDLRDALAADLVSLDSAQLVINYVQERAGLLQARDNRTYTFPHRTFQEYLAATHLQTFEDFDTRLREHLLDDLTWWREVFLLTAGSTRKMPRMVYDLVDTLVPDDPEEGRVSPATLDLVLLASQALDDTGFVQYLDREQARQPGRFSRCYQRVQSWLLAGISDSDNLKPAQRAAAGVALAKLGDPRPEVMTIEGMQFCYVPADPFWMGSGDEDDLADDDEKPQHELSLDDYWIGQYPVTNAQFDAFVRAGGYDNPAYWVEAKDAGVWRDDGKVEGYFDDEPRVAPAQYREPFGLPNHPVVGITWYEALAFTRWLTDVLREAKRLPTGWAVTLPSEAEWEKAARGGRFTPATPWIETTVRPGVALNTVNNERERRRYPWGDEPDPNRANYEESGIGATSAVGCFAGGGSVYGCQEMSGNVWEWTRSLWGDYPYKPGKERENLAAGPDKSRVLRGGSSFYRQRFVRCAWRVRINPSNFFDRHGFRVVVVPMISGL